MAAHNSCSCFYCFEYLDKWVDKSNNTYHHSIGKNPNDVNYSALTEEIETNLNLLNLTLLILSELLSTKIL